MLNNFRYIFRKTSFTLIELLLVLAIIGVLSSFLMPALSKAREKGRRAVCLSNLKQSVMLFHLYSSDSQDNLTSWESDTIHWPRKLLESKYLENYSLLLCPTQIKSINGYAIGNSKKSYLTGGGKIFGSYSYNNALAASSGPVNKVILSKISDLSRLPIFMEGAHPDGAWHLPTEPIPADLSNPMTGVAGGLEGFKRVSLAIHDLERGNYVFADGSVKSIKIQTEIKSLIWNELFEY